jgi:hypothetical protein
MQCHEYRNPNADGGTHDRKSPAMAFGEPYQGKQAAAYKQERETVVGQHASGRYEGKRGKVP